MIKKKLSNVIFTIIFISLICGILYWLESNKYPKPEWTTKEKLAISSLWLGNLPDLPPDPSNKYSDNLDAAKFGHQIFFDKRFSANGKIACATCHKPNNYFTDGLKLSVGKGITKRNTPSIVSSAYFPFNFWDGRIDSQWAQALDPLESIVEHGGSRLQYVHLIANDPNYARSYESLFGPLPNLSDLQRFPLQAGPVDKNVDPDTAKAWAEMLEQDRNVISEIFSNIGKAIAAYERLIMPAPARFDDYARALIEENKSNNKILSKSEVEGLRLFIGKARCLECHNGPLLTNDSFHNIAIPTEDGKPFDFGRSIGVHKTINAEFNCLSIYSDANLEDCSELRFIKRAGDDLAGSFKVPSLRNVSATAPYMHAGQFENLEAVIDHYNKAPNSTFGHSMLTKINLEEQDIVQLIAFLHTLDSTVAADPKWLEPPILDQVITQN